MAQRSTASLLTTACANRGIAVEKVHKTRYVLRHPEGPVQICRSLEAAWEHYKSDPTFRNAPLVSSTVPIRY